MRRLLIPLLLTVICSTLACAGSSDDSTTSLDGVDVAAEATATASHGDTPTDETMAKGVTELLVQEDPTIDASASAGANADSIAAQATSSTAHCASAQVTHTAGSTSVTVNFGSGCTYGNLGTVSGSVGVAVSESGGSVTVAFTFGALTVGTSTISGSASMTTSNGTSYSATLSLTNGAHMTSFTGSVVVDSNGLGVTINGTGTSQTATSGLISYTATGIHHDFAGCYADAGTLKLTKSEKVGNRTVNLTETILYDSNTPTTGEVTITINNAAPTSQQLPSHGSCPG